MGKRKLVPTKGPYSYSEQIDDKLPGRVLNARGQVIAECSNAHGYLLAASLDMLEALEMLTARFVLEPQLESAIDHCMCNQFLDQGDCRHSLALKAIAKAKKISYRARK